MGGRGGGNTPHAPQTTLGLQSCPSCECPSVASERGGWPHGLSSREQGGEKGAATELRGRLSSKAVSSARETGGFLQTDERLLTGVRTGREARDGAAEAALGH